MRRNQLNIRQNQNTNITNNRNNKLSPEHCNIRNFCYLCINLATLTMASSLSSILSDIKSKISELENGRRSLAERCSELERKNELLRQDLREAQRALEQSQLEVEYLRVSYRLAKDENSLIETRRKISSIIRRIDKAIALATDDPSL